MTHKKKDLPTNLSSYDLVVYGHSHRYDQKKTHKTSFLNPGNCGPRRFNQEITLALLTVDDGQIREVKRIDIPHANLASTLPEKTELKRIIERTMHYVDKGKTVDEIAGMLNISIELSEQICRLYLTHPGVASDGIMFSERAPVIERIFARAVMCVSISLSAFRCWFFLSRQYSIFDTCRVCEYCFPHQPYTPGLGRKAVSYKQKLFLSSTVPIQEEEGLYGLPSISPPRNIHLVAS